MVGGARADKPGVVPCGVQRHRHQKNAWPATSVTTGELGHGALRQIHRARADSRAIDDGAKFGHASGAGYSETIDLCTAVQHLQAREIAKALGNLGVPQPEAMELRLESGSDDLPSANRWVPLRPEEQFLDIVAVWIIGHFKRLSSHAFGLASAVNRLQSSPQTDACILTT